MATINARTLVCGSIARRASNLGAAMYNAAYEKLELDFVYLPFATSDTEGAINAMRTLGFRGLAAADPHNLHVAPLLDFVDPIAKRIGSVNTILNDHGNLKGFNSDWIGFKTAFEEVASISGRRVVVLGAGGAAKAIVYALTEGGSRDVLILNRTEEKARQLAKEYGVGSGSIHALNSLSGYDTLVNATPVGSSASSENELVDHELLRKFEVIVDMVFAPATTSLISMASKLGNLVVPGWRVLLHQGAFQFRMFTGTEPPVDYLSTILLKGLAS